MTTREANIALSAILTTAFELEPLPIAESHCYMALGSDMAKWEIIRGVLLAGKLVKIHGNGLHLTLAGQDIARKCQEFERAHKVA